MPATFRFDSGTEKHIDKVFRFIGVYAPVFACDRDRRKSNFWRFWVFVSLSVSFSERIMLLVDQN